MYIKKKIHQLHFFDKEFQQLDSAVVFGFAHLGSKQHHMALSQRLESTIPTGCDTGPSRNCLEPASSLAKPAFLLNSMTELWLKVTRVRGSPAVR